MRRSELRYWRSCVSSWHQKLTSSALVLPGIAFKKMRSIGAKAVAFEVLDREARNREGVGVPRDVPGAGESLHVSQHCLNKDPPLVSWILALV